MDVNPKQFYLKCFEIIVLFTVCVVFFRTTIIHVSPDSTEYMTQALNIHNGNGYSEMNGQPVVKRGPLYPFLLAASFKICGVSVHSAYLLTRLFFVLNMVALYLLVITLYDRLAAWLTVGLYLSSSLIYSIATPILLDIVWPFFILLFLVLFFRITTRGKENNDSGMRRYIQFSFLGVILFLSYITKEVALLLLPLPIVYLAFFRPGLLQRRKRDILLLYSVFFILLSGWLIYTHFQGARIESAYGNAPRIMTNSLFMQSSIPSEIISGFKKAYNKYLLGLFPIPTSLLLLALCIFLFRGIKNRAPADGLLISLLLCLLPLVWLIAKISFRNGQLFLPYLILFICFSKICSDIINWIMALNVFKNRPHTINPLNAISMGIIVVAFFTTCIYFDAKGPKQRIFGRSKKNIIQAGYLYLSPQEVKYTGHYNKQYQALADWIRKNAEPGAILYSGGTTQNILYFLTNGDYQLKGYGFLRSNQSGFGPFKASNNDNRRKIDPLKIRFIWPLRNKGTRDRQFPIVPILALSEKKLWDSIDAKSESYFVVPKRYGFLALLFDAHPSVERVFVSDNGNIKLYKAQTDSINCLEQFPLYVGDTLKEIISSLKEHYPDIYEKNVAQFVLGRMALSTADLESMHAGKNPAFKIFKKYN